jgi:hypothetical protein
MQSNYGNVISEVKTTKLDIFQKNCARRGFTPLGTQAREKKKVGQR